MLIVKCLVEHAVCRVGGKGKGRGRRQGDGERKAAGGGGREVTRQSEWASASRDDARLCRIEAPRVWEDGKYD